jgi:O-glycosyl hydrolase
MLIVMEKILELARKLKALAERGIGGEKENAAAMLNRLMKQHGITIDMISGTEKKDFVFYTVQERRQFLVQIIANVLGKKCNIFSYPSDARRKKKRVGTTCSPAEAVEIQAKFDFFWKAWESELDVFYSAFIQTNKLYSKKTGDEDDEERELTLAERQKLWKMANMMQGMDRHHFVKQITQ